MEQKYRWDFLGLSSEAKPITGEKVTDGSTFFECDTSKLYVFYQGTWYEKTSSVLTNFEKELKW